MAEEQGIRVTLVKEKETKNTIRFGEVTDGPPRIGTLYLQKWTVKELGSPSQIIVTIQAG